MAKRSWEWGARDPVEDDGELLEFFEKASQDVADARELELTGSNKSSMRVGNE